MTENGQPWAKLLRSYGVSDPAATRLIRALVVAEVSALAFCRLLERWARGEPDPSTPGRREAALRRAAERAETAVAGLEDPLGRYLQALAGGSESGRSWYGQPGSAELLEWGPVLLRAGVRASPVRVAQAYLELAVLIRALEGLSDAARMRLTPDRASLWAGLFDLRENLLGSAQEELRALAA